STPCTRSRLVPCRENLSWSMSPRTAWCVMFFCVKMAMRRSAPCLARSCTPCAQVIFCTREFLCSVDTRGAVFIIRQHEGLPFDPVNILRSVGRIETGHVAEQRVQVRDAQGQAHLFRRIQVKLDQATRDGDRVLYILTNIPLRKASAKRIARLYRKRWTLETAFQHLEAYFQSAI